MRMFEIVTIAILMLAIQSKAQPNKTSLPSNQTDSMGRKQGLWIESEGLKEVYYYNGVKDGIYRSYYKKNHRLESFGEFTNDVPSGTWYYFDETGFLILSQSRLERNSNLKVKRDDGNLVIFPLKSYVKVYHKNGKLCREGIALYEEDIQHDYFMFGDWKYYDTHERFLKNEYYKEGQVAP